MFQKVTLENDVHILTEAVPHVRSVAVGFLLMSAHATSLQK